MTIKDKLMALSEGKTLVKADNQRMVMVVEGEIYVTEYDGAMVSEAGIDFLNEELSVKVIEEKKKVPDENQTQEDIDLEEKKKNNPGLSDVTS